MKVIAIALLLGGLAYSQSPKQILIATTGLVQAGLETVHAKNGQTVRWGLVKGAASWYVIFTGPTSPCANGAKEFGSDTGLARTCKISKAPVGTYKYSTSDHRGGALHDPVIIIDQ